MMKKVSFLFVIVFCITKFINAQWVVKDLSQISSDGYNFVFFTDSLNGWMTANNGVLINTTDGGTNWVKKNTGFTGNLRELFFLDYNNGWITDSYGKLISTKNHGNTWESKDFGSQIMYINFKDSLNGKIVTASGKICITKNGGNNWQTLPDSSNTNVSIHDCYELDSNKIIGVGNSRISIYDGKKWNIKLNTWDLYSVDFIDSLKGWAVGAYGIIVNTIDGGNTWNVQQDVNTVTWGYLFSIHVIDSVNIWTVGDLGFILKYNGNSWVKQQNSLPQMLRSVYMINKNTGWATSWGGKVLYYSNQSSNVEELKIKTNNLSVFPNPALDEITINNNSNLTENIFIYNAFGSLVEKVEVKQSLKLNINKYSKGVYLLKNNENTLKFIKE